MPLSFAVATTMLCSVAELRAYAKISEAEYDYLNPVLVDIVSGTTGRVWDRVGGDKTIQTYNEYYDVLDYDKDYVVPRHTPVQSVVAMTLHVQGLGDSAVAASDIWYDDMRIGIVERFSMGVAQRYEGGSFFGTGRQRLHICYTAGLTTSRLLPLKLAVYAESAAWLNRMGFEGLAAVNPGAGVMTFEDNGWSRAANAILQDWGA